LFSQQRGREKRSASADFANEEMFGKIEANASRSLLRSARELLGVDASRAVDALQRNLIQG